jgi:hypothetical protein
VGYTVRRDAFLAVGCTVRKVVENYITTLSTVVSISTRIFPYPGSFGLRLRK